MSWLDVPVFVAIVGGMASCYYAGFTRGAARTLRTRTRRRRY